MYSGEEIGDISNFTLFSMIMNDERTADKKASVKQVLTILFPKY
jgi:hypothetical protein